MINGIVNDRNEAIIHLQVRGFSGTQIELDAVVDTGFSGFLALPMSIVSQLTLFQCGDSSVLLADGTTRPFALYSADVEWDGAFRNLLVSVLGDECLIGMKLLRDHELRLEVFPGGPVSVTEI